MKFIHTGDLHLDSPFRGLQEIPPSLWQKIHDSTFNAFKQIVDEAIALKVDFMLITGDIYDREQHSIMAEHFFAEQCRRLENNRISVLMLYGNHDYQLVSENNLLPDNVYVFPNQVTTKIVKLETNETVAISGFSYDQRWINDDQINRYPDRKNVTWHIGMIHGAMKQIPGHDHYAPFTINELQRKAYDYWALGHIHKHEVIAPVPPIVYCGTPQGRNKNEDGHHGYYLVESKNGKLVPTFKTTDIIQWQQVVINLTNPQTTTEVEETIGKQIRDKCSSDELSLVASEVTTKGKLPGPIRHLLLNGDILAHLQAAFLPQQKWWPYDLQLSEEKAVLSMTELDNQYWDKAANEVFTSTNIMELAASLTKHEFLAQKLTNIKSQQLKERVIKMLKQGDGPDDN